jgi:hypothetical protein
MRVAVSGASGLIGSALVPALREAGHEVLPLVRREPAGGEIGWDPDGGTLDAAALEGTDAIVHLAGESVGQRWSEEAKSRILRSRVEGTRVLAEAAAALEPVPALVSASAVGFYGTLGDEIVDETAPRGPGFLAEVAESWEEAAAPARAAGGRVVHLRCGIVLSPDGGALERMLTPFRLGAGGRLGNGRQWWSWVGLPDTVAAYRTALESELEGPVNVVADAARNADFVRALGRALHRPAVMPLPAFAVKAMFGQMGEEMLLGGQRVAPRVLEQRGFRFAQPSLDDALAAAVAA